MGSSQSTGGTGISADEIWREDSRVPPSFRGRKQGGFTSAWLSLEGCLEEVMGLQCQVGVDPREEAGREEMVRFDLWGPLGKAPSWSGGLRRPGWG